MKIRYFSMLLLALFALGGCMASRPPAQPQNISIARQATSIKIQHAVNVAGENAQNMQMMAGDGSFMDFHIQVNRAMIVSGLQDELVLTDEQKACLLSAESHQSYAQVLQPYFASILSAEEIRQADAFFASEAGRKFAQILLGNDHDGLQNMSITDSQRNQIFLAVSKPFFTKVKANKEAMSSDEAVSFMLPMVQQEIIRCQLGQ